MAATALAPAVATAIALASAPAALLGRGRSSTSNSLCVSIHVRMRNFQAGKDAALPSKRGGPPTALLPVKASEAALPLAREDAEEEEDMVGRARRSDKLIKIGDAER